MRARGKMDQRGKPGENRIYDSKQACETLAIHGGSKFNIFLTEIWLFLVIIYAITSDSTKKLIRICTSNKSYRCFPPKMRTNEKSPFSFQSFLNVHFKLCSAYHLNSLTSTIHEVLSACPSIFASVHAFVHASVQTSFPQSIHLFEFP